MQDWHKMQSKVQSNLEKWSLFVLYTRFLLNEPSYLLSVTTDNEIPLDSNLAEMYNNIS